MQTMMKGSSAKICCGALLVSLFLAIISTVRVPLSAVPEEESITQPVLSDNRRTAASTDSGIIQEVNAASVAVTTDDNDDDIEWTDSIFQRQGWNNDPVVLESHKLLFFTIPKNACSSFKKLFRRMMGNKNWLAEDAHNPKNNGLRYLGTYSREKQREFMTSSEWTRAVFLRDPFERALSAYMDKALQSGPKEYKPPVNGAFLKRQCCGMRMRDKNTKLSDQPVCTSWPMTPYEAWVDIWNFKFETFLTQMVPNCPNDHWKPQYQRMHPTNWKHINFVGHFETLKEDTHRLLNQIGAFEEFGAHGWSKNASRDLAIFETTIDGHQTGSKSQMDGGFQAWADYYLNNATQVDQAFWRLYRQDYEFDLFNFTRPCLTAGCPTEGQSVPSIE